ncbi:MAG: hypothetical protein J6334_08470 [Kiritimatiellae bacterium]|nr:hypothetical protein [Kiritimatiellia bacterium]
MRNSITYRRTWMLTGFAAAFLIGDFFLVLRGASTRSVEFLFGVAGFSLAQLFWTMGQVREARPDGRLFLAAAFPLSAFVLTRLAPPALPRAAQIAVWLYSLLTALSLATALPTRRPFYTCGIALLLFSDLMIGGRILKIPGCGALTAPTYLAAEVCLLISCFWNGEGRIPYGRVNLWRTTLIGGGLAFLCFTLAALLYPGGGYNPFRKMLSVLGRTEIRKIAYPPCHHWFVAGLFLAATTVAAIWARLAGSLQGWRRQASGWGGAVNVAGLYTIALVPENVLILVHNLGCNLAVIGGATILAARFRKTRGDWIWAGWILALVTFFIICLRVKALPFNPWVTATQKVLILTFALWSAWIARQLERDGSSS